MSTSLCPIRSPPPRRSLPYLSDMSLLADLLKDPKKTLPSSKIEHDTTVAGLLTHPKKVEAFHDDTGAHRDAWHSNAEVARVPIYKEGGPQ